MEVSHLKRDIELIRKLILAVEEFPTAYPQHEIGITGYTKEQIGYHAYLLVDAGLAKGLDATTMGDTSPQWHILHLTSAGHDFADAARSDSNWQKAKGIVKDKAGSVSLDVMKQVLVSVIRDALGL